MLYIYEVMKLVRYLIMKHVIKKHKEYSTTLVPKLPAYDEK